MTLLMVLKIGTFLMIGLLYAEYRQGTGLKLAFKAPLSVLFILTGIVQPQILPGYWWTMVIGLVLCLGGDVFLALPGQKNFRLGLVSFLLGHVAYVVAFLQLASLNHWFSPWALIPMAISTLVFLWLKPHLGEMKVPVLAYVIVISLMVIGALAALLGPSLSPRGPQFALIGAVLFYLSDLFVARDRFVQPGFINRLIGLPLYYVGQFTLAFSIGYVG